VCSSDLWFTNIFDHPNSVSHRICCLIGTEELQHEQWFQHTGPEKRV